VLIGFEINVKTYYTVTLHCDRTWSHTAENFNRLSRARERYRRQTDGRQNSETFAKMLHGRFVHVGKTVIDLQILGCEFHQNAFGGRAPPGPAGGAIVLPRHSRY